MAQANNTQVRISPAVPGSMQDVIYLENGASERIWLPSNVSYSIVANQAIQVAQVVLSQEREDSHETADPSMTLLIPTTQFDNFYTVATPLYAGLTEDRRPGKGEYQNTFMVVMESRWVSNLMLNHQPVRLLRPLTVMHLGIEYTTGYIDLHKGGQAQYYTLMAEDPRIVFGAYLYGYADRESYGLPCGARMATINPCKPQVDPRHTECIDGNFLFIIGDGQDNDCDNRIDEDNCRGEPQPGEDCATMYIGPCPTINPPTPPRTTPTTQQPIITTKPTTMPPFVYPPPTGVSNFGGVFYFMFLENMNPALLQVLVTPKVSETVWCNVRYHPQRPSSVQASDSFRMTRPDSQVYGVPGM